MKIWMKLSISDNEHNLMCNKEEDDLIDRSKYERILSSLHHKIDEYLKMAF
jgi:hypothetical protein